MKECSKCKISKEESDFYKLRVDSKSRQSSCNSCHKLAQQLNCRTKKGFFSKTYNSQRKSSKRRGFGLPLYSKEWLVKWLIGDEKFNTLWNEWVESGYCKMKIPSIDRVDCEKPYSKSNIQLTTWAENKAKGHDERKRSKANNKTGLKHIYQVSGIYYIHMTIRGANLYIGKSKNKQVAVDIRDTFLKTMGREPARDSA